METMEATSVLWPLTFETSFTEPFITDKNNQLGLTCAVVKRASWRYTCCLLWFASKLQSKIFVPYLSGNDMPRSSCVFMKTVNLQQIQEHLFISSQELSRVERLLNYFSYKQLFIALNMRPIGINRVKWAGVALLYLFSP